MNHCQLPNKNLHQGNFNSLRIRLYVLRIREKSPIHSYSFLMGLEAQKILFDREGSGFLGADSRVSNFQVLVYYKPCILTKGLFECLEVDLFLSCFFVASSRTKNFGNKKKHPHCKNRVHPPLTWANHLFQPVFLFAIPPTMVVFS